jgi:hypothetical protein
MGEVVSFAKASQSDVFSMFDDACPALPEDTDREMIVTATRTVGDKSKLQSTRFRSACVVIGALSVLGVLLTVVATGGLTSGRQGVHSAPLNFSSDLVVTDEFTLDHSSNTVSNDLVSNGEPAWRHSREAWLAHIAALENDPTYRRVVREKRLFALTYPDTN